MTTVYQGGGDLGAAAHVKAPGRTVPYLLAVHRQLRQKCMIDNIIFFYYITCIKFALVYFRTLQLDGNYHIRFIECNFVFWWGSSSFIPVVTMQILLLPRFFILEESSGIFWRGSYNHIICLGVRTVCILIYQIRLDRGRYICPARTPLNTPMQ